MSQAKISLVVCCILLLSGCSVFGTKKADEQVADEVALLMLDQQILETRMSLAEDKIIVLQEQVDSFQKPEQAETKVEPKAEEPAEAATETPVQETPEQKSETAALTANEAYKEGMAYYKAGKYRQATDVFASFPAKYPKSTLVPNAGYWLGECHYSQKQYDMAILSFQSVAASYPKHDKAAAALLKTGYSYERLGDKPNARFYLEQLLEVYPKSEPAPLARAALGKLQ